MKFVLLCISFFLIVECFYSVDARRGGGGRFGGSRFSSSRYSSSRYSSYRYSSYRFSYRSSYRSYRSYFRRYSSRYSYRSRYSSVYRSSMKVSAVGMGGLASNKQALLLAGSVYIAYSIRPRVFTIRGSLYSGVADDYAVCVGLVRWDSLNKNGSYGYDAMDWNSSSTGAATTAIPTSAGPLLARNGNATVESTDGADGTTVSPTGRFVTYKYFLCPSDLFNNKYDAEDIYCCGPAGSQMCCSREDFEEQLGEASGVGRGVGIFFGIVFAVILCGCPIYMFRSKIRNCLRCRNCSGCLHSSGSNSNSGQATARPDVSFHQVAKADEEPDVALSGIRSAEISPPASGQAPYPIYSPQINSGVGEQLQYPLYPPTNGNGAQQMPPLPSHPPPAYKDL